MIASQLNSLDMESLLNHGAWGGCCQFQLVLYFYDFSAISHRLTLTLYVYICTYACIFTVVYIYMAQNR